MEKILNLIRSINAHEFWVSLQFLSMIVLPGILAIWIYDYELIKESGILKLIFLASVISFPSAFLHFILLDSFIFFTRCTDEKIIELTGNTTVNLLLGANLSGFILYAMCLASFFFSITLFNFVLSIFVLNLIFFLILFGVLKLRYFPEDS